MKGSKLLVSALAACMLAVLLGASPAAATDDYPAPTGGIVVSGTPTGVASTCHHNGTGAAGQRGTWRNTPNDPSSPTANYSNGHPNEALCAQSIVTFMRWMASHQDTVNATLIDQLRAALFTGTPNLTDPYEVFLNDLYITQPALAALAITSPGSSTGLGSCNLQPELLLIRCRDNSNGRITLRDQYGNPISINGQVQYFYLNGLLSVWGGGLTYGSTFIENYQGRSQTFDFFVEHHEQVHSQQWAIVGWQFVNYYLGQQSTSLGNALNYLFVWGPVGGVNVPAQCFNTYERDAGFMDGDYAFRTSDRLPQDQSINLTVSGTIATGATQAWPTGWTEGQNETNPRCPSTWT